jgi:alpha-N-arabinofuranosidase
MSKRIFAAGVLRRAGIVMSVFSAVISAQNTLTLNVDQAKYKIERTIYGHLWENLGRNVYDGVFVGTKSTVPNTDGFRNDVTQAFIDEGMSCLEWPGGCAAWSYHWKNGTGPVASRPGGEMGNGVGTAEYFKYCKMINSVPYITCNLRNASVAENTAWLKYIDSVPEWKNSLKYWKIGNEEFGGCGNGGNVDTFITHYLANVAGIPASYDGKLIRIAEAGTEPAWASKVFDKCMGKMEAISYHYYSVDWGNKGSSTDFNEQLYYKQLQSAWGLEGKLQGFEQVMNTKDPNNTVGIIVDEWGAWYNEVPDMGTLYQQSSQRDAVLAMMSLNIFNNHCKRVKMALAAQAVNVLFASMLTQKAPATGMVKTPTYYVFKMLRPHQDATMIPVKLTCGNVSNIPILSASASIDSLKNIHISLGNNHATAQQTLAVTLSGTTMQYAQVTGQIVNGAAYTNYNDFNKEEMATLKDFPSSNYSLSGAKLTVTLPAHSAVMLNLLVPVGVPLNAKPEIFRDLSIHHEANGSILIRGSALKKSPIHLALFTLDGQMIANVKAVSKDYANQIIWKPGISGNGVYIIKAQIDGVSESQKVTLSL